MLSMSTISLTSILAVPAFNGPYSTEKISFSPLLNGLKLPQTELLRKNTKHKPKKTLALFAFIIVHLSSSLFNYIQKRYFCQAFSIWQKHFSYTSWYNILYTRQLLKLKFCSLPYFFLIKNFNITQVFRFLNKTYIKTLMSCLLSHKNIFRAAKLFSFPIITTP